MILDSSAELIVKSVWILLGILLILVMYYLINIGNNFIPEQKKINIKNRTLLLILVIFIIFYSLYKLFEKYDFLSDILFTLIISMIFAYILNPIINYLERKNINRLKGVLIVYLSIIALLAILAFSVIPRSGREIRRLVNDLPTYFEQLSNMIDGLYTRYYSTLGGLPPLFQGIETVVMDNIIKLESMIATGLQNFVEAIINVATKVVSIVLTPILTLYFLMDKDYFKDQVIKIIPKRYRRDTLHLASAIDNSLTQFIRGRLIMSLYVGVVTTVTLLLMGIEFAVVIGFITGLFDIVPYIGPFIGFVPAFFFAFISSPIKAIWISIIFVLIQWTENNIIAPKILGDNIGMHPMLVLLSLIIGGGIFGVIGMILSVPLVAVIKIIFEFALDRRKNISGKP